LEKIPAITVKLTMDRKKQLEDYCGKTGQGVASLVRMILYRELDAQG